MARKPSQKNVEPPQTARLTSAELSLLERLVDHGALITVPALKSQKPRKVVAAALAEHGTKVLLYLSARPAE
jgi:hypothetical protein